MELFTKLTTNCKIYLKYTINYTKYIKNILYISKCHVDITNNTPFCLHFRKWYVIARTLNYEAHEIQSS
jgi:hypothetical protein